MNRKEQELLDCLDRDIRDLYEIKEKTSGRMQSYVVGKIDALISARLSIIKILEVYKDE